MKKITTYEELMNELESGAYNYYGLRKATNHDIELIESGRDYLDCSFDWVDNSRTDTLLDGTCAIWITEYMAESELKKRHDLVEKYEGKTILLLGGKKGTPGEDNGEIILGGNGYGADVIALVEI